jgi:GNAT superfamily N-acetyltransferase
MLEVRTSKAAMQSTEVPSERSMVMNRDLNTASLSLRPGRLSDAPACGAICYTAFRTISETHNFPPDFPSIEAATGLMATILSKPGVHSVIAEVEQRIVGSNFLWEDTIAGVGPITVDPAVQNGAIGRRLMQHVLQYADSRRFVGVRLVQAAYHNRSLSFYTKLGFLCGSRWRPCRGPRSTNEYLGTTFASPASRTWAHATRFRTEFTGTHGRWRLVRRSGGQPRRSSFEMAGLPGMRPGSAFSAT